MDEMEMRRRLLTYSDDDIEDSAILRERIISGEIWRFKDKWVSYNGPKYTSDDIDEDPLVREKLYDGRLIRVGEKYIEI